MLVTECGWPFHCDTKDSAPGETNGHGAQYFGEEWCIVTPWAPVLKAEERRIPGVGERETQGQEEADHLHGLGGLRIRIARDSGTRENPFGTTAPSP